MRFSNRGPAFAMRTSVGARHAIRRSACPCGFQPSTQFAEHLYTKINTFLKEETEGRVKAIKVEVYEHEKNQLTPNLVSMIKTLKVV